MLQDLIAELAEYDAIAHATTRCKRKGVAAVALTLPFRCICWATNGPAEGHTCKNIVGGCGCEHSEQRLLTNRLLRVPRRTPRILYTTYSPCDTCATKIVESGLISGWIYRHFADHWPKGVEIATAGGIEVLSVASIEAAIAHNERLKARIIYDTFERWQSPLRNGG